jgi:hypothetical protein
MKMTMRTTLCMFAVVAVAAMRQASAAAFVPLSSVASVHCARRRSSGYSSSSRCFQVSPPTPPSSSSSSGGKDDFINDEELLFPVDTTPSSSIDWDAEWKKVVKEQKTSPTSFTSKEKKRPGEGYYKSEAEIRAIKAANKAAAKLNEAQASMPSWDSIKGDWKFWVGVLMILSIGSSLLAANSGPGIVYYDQPPSSSGGAGAGSYFI